MFHLSTIKLHHDYQWSIIISTYISSFNAFILPRKWILMSPYSLASYPVSFSLRTFLLWSFLILIEITEYQPPLFFQLTLRWYTIPLILSYLFLSHFFILQHFLFCFFFIYPIFFSTVSYNFSNLFLSLFLRTNNWPISVRTDLDRVLEVRYWWESCTYVENKWEDTT